MTRKRHNDQGMILPMTALLLVVLLALSALAIDVGMAYTARTSMQHAADAAALAGAFSFTIPTAMQPEAAITAAVSVAAKTAVLGQPVTISPGDVAVDTDNRRVTVTVARAGANGIATYFARAIGRQKIDVRVQATAEAATRAAGDYCIKPFFLPNTIVSNLSPKDACAAGEYLFRRDGELSSFVAAKWGNLIDLRPINPGGSLAPSQFYSLQLGGPGASTYQCAISQCLNTCPTSISSVRCGIDYPLETGNMVGPTTKGINDFIGSDPDQWVAVGQYRRPDGSLADTSRSLIAVPVWDNCTQTLTSGTNGQQPKVIGFLQVFVTGVAGQSVTARLVNATGCSVDAGTPGTSTGPYAVPVRLIQNPVQQ